MRRWPPRIRVSSARCRCRWPTGGWCGARAGCLCPGPASITRGSCRCSASASCIPARCTRCLPGWVQPRQRRGASWPTRRCAQQSRTPTTQTILGPSPTRCSLSPKPHTCGRVSSPGLAVCRCRDPARWPQALELLATPSLRAALVEPARVLLADGRHADVPSCTAWWLRRHPVLGGHRPTDVRAAGTDPLLAGLYDEAALPADPAVARALGVRISLAELLAEPGGADELLDRLADSGPPAPRAQVRALWP